MTQGEKIIAEIKRLYEKNETYPKKDRDLINMGLYRGRKQALKMLLDFIDVIPTEQPSEELKKVASIFMPEEAYHAIIENEEEGSGESVYDYNQMVNMFIAGAQWQKEQTINKACEWLNKNVVEYHPRKGELRPIVNTNAFREAMEKEDEQ